MTPDILLRVLVEAWLKVHPDVQHHVSPSGIQQYSFKGSTISWVADDRIVASHGGGQLVFKSLHCPKCQKKPLIIQALEYLVHRKERRA